MPDLVKFYRHPGLTHSQNESVYYKINTVFKENSLTSVDTELCYYIQVEPESNLSEEEKSTLRWVLSVPFQEERLNQQSALDRQPGSLFFEIGPRLNFSTAQSTNSVSLCHSFGLRKINRIEVSTRYVLTFKAGHLPSPDDEARIINSLHDRMTQCCYVTPLTTFDLNINPDPIFEVDILGEGKDALRKANTTLGLAFDDWDIDYYTKLFQDQVKRNPTSVECFDLAQSNSEHSRHWFFKGRLVVDGKEFPKSLFSMIMDTQLSSNNNNIIKFNDNSSAIKGFPVRCLVADSAVGPSKLNVKKDQTRHIIFTAETHNFPTGVAPFPGATTGTGGRIRDVQATGRGAHVIAGTAGYSFGSLCIPGYNLPWENSEDEYPPNFALPVDVAVEASNGASDYGNKFGEPVLAGFARSYGLTSPNRERREYIKPIMFSGGIGMLDSEHVTKDKPDVSMDVVKMGGPVYRIGLGGGAASSVLIQGDNKAELDFSAVQRGDAEMEQKLNRFLRACIELGPRNPIRSIHDQGAGGNGNVIKELVEPEGALIKADNFQLGDPTISVMELWGAEYQESNAALVGRDDLSLIESISKRERCPVYSVGSVTGSGKIELESYKRSHGDGDNTRKPVDLKLEYVLGSMPCKIFEMKRIQPVLTPLLLPDALKVQEALGRVLRLPSVASKRYLTSKVDRSVTGLIAQQQCVGPLHIPLADVAVVALSYFETVGSATAIGEQPIKGLLDPAAGARLSVAEALTNLMFASITNIKDVKCSGNWMWPAKLEGEGVALLDACEAMCSFMSEVGVAIDGGKDSLSMAARVGKQAVKAPGTLVVSTYVGCPDIRLTVTPDFKCPGGEGVLLYLPMSGSNKWRLGGSALAHCFKQLGNEVPDVEAQSLVKGFNAVQDLIRNKKVQAGHDISDGGLIVCLLEMAFAGNCGLVVNIPVSSVPHLNVLFAEEVGAVLEVSKEDVDNVTSKLSADNVPYIIVGKSVGRELDSDANVSISVDSSLLLESAMWELRDAWEETSFALERRQTNPHCAEEEQKGLKTRKAPPFTVNFDPDSGLTHKLSDEPPKVAIIREEGSNGDREMAAAFALAGFEAWDVNMEDLIQQKISLSSFRGIVFVGGFSYADVCGSAKGWAATAKYNQVVSKELAAFRSRSDTFSFGVCNGCQLMALLGWVAPDQTAEDPYSQGLLLDHNKSGRFESRFVTVKVESSPAIMLHGMEGTIWGVWSCHGEGQMVFKRPDIQASIESNKLVPIRFVDDQGLPTEVYPLNPNGSPAGIAGVCSLDGRHLAIMPHPERCILSWQCPWAPNGYKGANSPWIQMFENAYNWCLGQ